MGFCTFNLLFFYLQEIISTADKDANAEIDFAEFAQYMREHESKLRLAFSDLDKNKDGLLRYSFFRSTCSNKWYLSKTKLREYMTHIFKLRYVLSSPKLDATI